MEAQWLSVILLGAGLILTLIIRSVNVTSALSSALGDAKKEVNERVDRELRMVGETMSAFRQELHNVRLHGAETYQRRDAFHQQMDAFNQSINSRFEKIETAMHAGFEKTDKKIDRIFERITRNDHPQ